MDQSFNQFLMRFSAKHIVKFFNLHREKTSPDLIDDTDVKSEMILISSAATIRLKHHGIFCIYY